MAHRLRRMSCACAGSPCTYAQCAACTLTCCCTAVKARASQLPFNLVLSSAVLRPHAVHTAVQPRYQEVVDKMVGQLVRLLWEQERAGNGRYR